MCYALCSIIGENLYFVGSHVKAKFNDDLLTGKEHTRKIIPDCHTPSPQRMLTLAREVSLEEKIGIIIDDPKFGMFGLFKYQIQKGYKNKVLKQHNTVYCSHIFSSMFALPLLVFVAQWMMWIAIVSSQYKDYINKNTCPNEATIENKMIFFAILLIYFVKSFFLWDNLTDRTRLNRMTPAIDVWVLLDTIQEYGFNLIIYATNIWLVYVADSPGDMVMDALAMEFIMNLDNEFMTMYFNCLPEVGEEIYDNDFVTYRDNVLLIEHEKRKCCFSCMQKSFYIPFKLLVFSLFLFPILCLGVMITGTYCK
uniref:Uncharacterized protein n=1 Tax=viral metagenome TaxID=1070528 RepID=A0A6C0C443_9ZZZZ